MNSISLSAQMQLIALSLMYITFMIVFIAKAYANDCIGAKAALYMGLATLATLLIMIFLFMKI